MSTTIDNITLALLSLQDDLKTYLDSNGWKNLYTIALAGDPSLRGKELVTKYSDRRQEILLPLITLETGQVFNDVEELGNEYGTDKILLSIVVNTIDDNQLRTLANVIRRHLNDYTFDVNNYNKSKKSKVGTAMLTNTQLDDISDWDSPNVATKHIALVNSTMELTAQSLI